MRAAALTLAALGWAGLSVMACSSTPDVQSGGRLDAAGLDGASETGARLDGSGGDALADGGDAGTDAGGPICLGDKLEADGGATDSDGGIDCSGATAACAPLCASIVSHYRVGVAQYAAQCIRTLATCEGGNDVIPCVDQALAKACAQASSPGYCGPLRASCLDESGDAALAGDTFTERGCEMFANGLSANGRSTFSACVTSTTPDGGCPYGVVMCADQIRQ